MTATPRSRLLQKLDAEVEAAARAGEQRRAQVLRAQRAMLLARQGDLPAAREELTHLHQAAFASPHPELGAWLHLAEGLMTYYTDFGTAAIERLQRALSLAQVAGAREAQVLALAYLAMLHMVNHRFDALGHSLERGLALATEDDLQARARLYLVIAMTLHHADDAEGAAPWYAKARACATAAGDDAALSALLHNNTQFRVAAVRRAALQGRAPALAGLLPGVQSMDNFDHALGMHALTQVNPLLRAQVLVVTGAYAEALKLFEAHLPHALATGLERMGSSMLADTAWCRAQLGQQEAALAQARESELEIDPRCDTDDQAATHSRLAQVFSHLQLSDDAQRHGALAQQRWSDFAAEQARWREVVRAALEKGH
jgi:hypothetical protein